MLKKKSYSQPRLNPSHASNPSSYARYNRLAFPKVGDSGFYGGVGKRHYDNQSIKQLILNYGYQKGLIKKTEEPTSSPIFEKNKNTPQTKNQSQKSPTYDSLTKLQAEFDKIKATQKQRQRSAHEEVLYSEKLTRKNTLTTPRKSESHLRLFGEVGDLYGMVGSKGQYENSPRIFNPTNLSSKFSAI